MCKNNNDKMFMILKGSGEMYIGEVKDGRDVEII
jgi:mannose-6-phosphate isomerase-like protein (cupin superfamily)